MLPVLVNKPTFLSGLDPSDQGITLVLGFPFLPEILLPYMLNALVDDGFNIF